MSTTCQAYNLGVIEYEEALLVQDQILRARLAGDAPDTILFLQHPTVFSIGTSGGEQHIITPRDILDREGITVVHSDRGGNVTVHELGQLVCYPIFNLNNIGRDLHQYVRNLEQVVIRTLSDYSIIAHRDFNHPGVWVNEEKICAVGIRVTKWITKHGFALNINNKLKYFSYVNPCGITDRGVTSMFRLLGYEIDIEATMMCVIDHFSKVFNLDVELNPVKNLGKVLC